MPGATSFWIISSAYASGISSGGVTSKVMVRRLSRRRIVFGPAVRSISTNSPNGMVPASGVCNGMASNCSGVCQSGVRTMISRRSSPSKYSPTCIPSPSMRDTLASESRFQPASLIRLSWGMNCNSGSANSNPGRGRTRAPGNFSGIVTKPVMADSMSASMLRP